jgi:hypothetical protein
MCAGCMFEYLCCIIQAKFEMSTHFDKFDPIILDKQNGSSLGQLLYALVIFK